MKRKISKVVVLTSVLIVLATGLTACGKKQCDICGETARCKTVEVLGEKVNICGDCQDGLNELKSLF